MILCIIIELRVFCPDGEGLAAKMQENVINQMQEDDERGVRESESGVFLFGVRRSHR